MSKPVQDSPSRKSGPRRKAGAKTVEKTARKPAARKSAAKKAPSGPATARKAAARKTAAKKAGPKKAAPKKAGAKKAVRKKAASRKAVSKKAGAKKAAARKPGSKKAASRKAAAKKASARKRPARKKARAEKKPSAAAKPRRPRPREPRAHPDSGLNRTEVKALHRRLREERETVLAATRKSVHDAVDEVVPFAESIDRAQHETEQNFRLRLADKQRKLLNEIEAALQKMATGEYGICEGTEDPIGYRRLEIRPWARYSVEYKELKDRRDR